MSGWSGIYFRYDIENEHKYALEKISKGLIGRQYKGFSPYNIFVRATESMLTVIKYICGSRTELPGNELMARTIDVDFVKQSVCIGYEAERYYEDTKDTVFSSFFFNDCNYFGGFLVDFRGKINIPVEVSEEFPDGEALDLKMKYAFVDDTNNPTKIMTFNEYVEHFSDYFTEEFLGEELAEEVKEIVEAYTIKGGIDENLMTMEEVKEFMGPASVEEYTHA